MMYVGFVLLALAIGAVVVGLLQRRKLGQILATPFKSTSQALAAGGDVSCEGEVHSAEPLTAPCSGRPCLYYEVEVKQRWEKQVATENGTQKKTGAVKAHQATAGSVFEVDDGSGAVQIDGQEGLEGELTEAFRGKGPGSGHLQFGQMHLSIGYPSEGRPTGTECVERIVPAEGKVFVLGRADGGRIRKRDGLGGSLLLSTKGRDHLLGSTKRNMIAAFVAAAVLLPAGGGLAAFGGAPAGPSTPSCGAQIQDSIDECRGRIRGHGDVTMSWQVSEPGAYRVAAVGTGRDRTLRLWPRVTITNASGQQVFTASGTNGDPIEATTDALEPGSYTVRVNDVSAGHAARLEGGAGFSFDVDRVEGQ